MPCAILQCNNGYAQTTILNSSDKDLSIDIFKPFEVKEFDNKILCNHISGSNYNKLLTNNLEKLRKDHMNSEERDAITQLCYEYRDILFHEEIPLTFTHEIKHHIRTNKNEAPIYVKPVS